MSSLRRAVFFDRELRFLALFGLAFLLLISGATTGCGPNKRQTTLMTAMAGVDAISEGFKTFDLEYQRKLVKESTSREDGLEKLARYHEKRAPVVKGLEAAYRALYVASSANDDVSVKNALAIIDTLTKQWQQLSGGSR